MLSRVETIDAGFHRFHILYTVNLEIFARVLFGRMRSFVKTKPSQNGKITLSFTDIGKSCPSHELLTSQICQLTLFATIKFSEFTV